MTEPRSIDGVLVQWGDRLFYPGNRRVPTAGRPIGTALRDRAAVIRQRIEASVRRPSQVMVKVTGGGRGMVAIAAHLRYICKNGRLPMEDDRGNAHEGREAMHDVAEQWRLGGSRIPERSERREAFNIMLSMPRGTDPLIVQRAAREFAKAELAGHRYVMVLHDHQANPHVHLSVRAESRQGHRLNPRKADLQRWRETFAEKLRGWGIEAEATRQITRGEQRSYPTLWRQKAQAQGRLRQPAESKTSQRFGITHQRALEAWVRIHAALTVSTEPADRELAVAVRRYVNQMPSAIDLTRRLKLARQQELPGMRKAMTMSPTPPKAPLIDRERTRSGPEMER